MNIFYGIQINVFKLMNIFYGFQIKVPMEYFKLEKQILKSSWKNEHMEIVRKVQNIRYNKG